MTDQTKLLKAYKAISLLPVPECQCGECNNDPDVEETLASLPEYRMYFECRTCHREVPYCYGAADSMPDSCDACWSATYGQGTPTWDA